MRKPKPVFSLSRCTSTSSYSGPERRHLRKLNLQRQINLRLHRPGGTHADSRRWPWTFHKGRRGRVCSGQIPLWSQAQMYGAVAGLGKVCQVAKLGQIGLPEGCHVGPTGQATMRRRTADGSFMWHPFLKSYSLNTLELFFGSIWLRVFVWTQCKDATKDEFHQWQQQTAESASLIIHVFIPSSSVLTTRHWQLLSSIKVETHGTFN